MRDDTKFTLGVIALLLAVFGSLLLHNCVRGYYIASSIDPIATACAFGDQPACIVYAGRKAQ